jgi:hypothetical protein
MPAEGWRSKNPAAPDEIRAKIDSGSTVSLYYENGKSSQRGQIAAAGMVK